MTARKHAPFSEEDEINADARDGAAVVAVLTADPRPHGRRTRALDKAPEAPAVYGVGGVGR